MADFINLLIKAQTCIQNGKNSLLSTVSLGTSGLNGQLLQFQIPTSETPLGPEMREVFNENISSERQEELDNLEQVLRNRYDNDVTGELSHADIGHILRDLQNDDTLTDLEKAYIFTELANNKEGGAWVFGIGGDDGDYKINNVGVRPELIDSAIFNGDATQVHTVVGFDDGYHGRLGGEAGDNGAAEAEVAEHEDGWLPDFLPTIPRISDNEGDENASLATIDALRAYRDGGFDAFADTWIDNMLVDDWEDIVETQPAPPEMTPPRTTVPEIPTTSAPGTGTPNSPTTTTPTHPPTTTTPPPPAPVPHPPTGTTTNPDTPTTSAPPTRTPEPSRTPAPPTVDGN